MNLILTPIKHGLALKKEITFCRREGGKNLKASNPPEKKKSLDISIFPQLKEIICTNNTFIMNISIYKYEVLFW